MRSFRLSVLLASLLLSAQVYAAGFTNGANVHLPTTGGTNVSGTVTGINAANGQVTINAANAAGQQVAVTLAPSATPGYFTVVSTSNAGLIPMGTVIGESAATVVIAGTGAALVTPALATAAALTTVVILANGNNNTVGTTGTAP
jgi:hypothetical protein